jgi:Fe-S cluster assembly iron-binding protein IscA
MKGYTATLRIQADAEDTEDLTDKLLVLFATKYADFVADWEIDFNQTNETKPNWEYDGEN